MKIASKIVHAGRDKKWTGYSVNVPVVRASTVVFETVSELKHATAKRGEQVPYYGRRGTQTHFAFSDAICELEGGAGCALYPCGAAAISGALLAFLQSGDHLLMVDSVYEPTRALCDKLLKNLGIETTYYDPLVGAGIKALIRPNTKVIFLESPGSITMEVQDVPAICAVAKQHNVLVMLDNTWASPVLFKPFAHGVDVSIQAATKYIVGHSDVMLGTASANEKYWPQLREASYLLGYCASADDVYLAARGLRTIGVRLAQHQQNTAQVLAYLQQRPEIARILHPSLPDHPGHAEFTRDFSGSNGLLSLVLKQGDAKAVTAFVEGMQFFKMGFSWGGYESLVTFNLNLQSIRTATLWPYTGPVIRLHIGLEDPTDLIADLAAAFERFNNTLAS
ncbi:MAG TPA: cystathionine beta-lyase [Rheinheimera sp.]|uniref:cystathionine beta-lyase n=1 Tax=Rheinheimera sp. TaxID=1869214 RepID=UPI000ED28AEA|nr:cystathionine beta-lyase [Rheinheimera sp.]HCU64243.1 cystathionine beta-lyase [Rheinheimera sp.]